MAHSPHYLDRSMAQDLLELGPRHVRAKTPDMDAVVQSWMTDNQDVVRSLCRSLKTHDASICWTILSALADKVTAHRERSTTLSSVDSGETYKARAIVPGDVDEDETELGRAQDDPEDDRGSGREWENASDDGPDQMALGFDFEVEDEAISTTGPGDTHRGAKRRRRSPESGDSDSESDSLTVVRQRWTQAKSRRQRPDSQIPTLRNFNELLQDLAEEDDDEEFDRLLEICEDEREQVEQSVSVYRAKSRGGTRWHLRSGFLINRPYAYFTYLCKRKRARLGPNTSYMDQLEDYLASSENGFDESLVKAIKSEKHMRWMLVDRDD